MQNKSEEKIALVFHLKSFKEHHFLAPVPHQGHHFPTTSDIMK